MYIIRPFGLIDIEDSALLLAPMSSVRLTDISMINFLSGLGGEAVSRFEKEDLLNMMNKVNLSSDDSLLFLEEVGILEVSSDEEGYAPFKQVVLVSDIDMKVSRLDCAFNADGVSVIVTTTPKNASNLSPPEKTLFVVFLERYEPNIIKNLYNLYAGLPGSGFIHAYYFRHELKIDGVFFPEIGTPCHFCHLERWRSREMRSFGSNKNSWYQVIELLSGLEKEIPPSIPLTDCDRQFSAQILRRRVQQIAGVPENKIHLDSFISSTSSDLISCHTTSEPMPHWHSCGCLKGEF